MVKVGLRHPSLKKSIKARTTAKWKRQIKGSIIPWYGQREMGWLHPRRKIRGMIYNRTTFSIGDVFNAVTGKKSARQKHIVTLSIIGLLLRYWYLVVIGLVFLYFKFR